MVALIREWVDEVSGPASGARLGRRIALDRIQPMAPESAMTLRHAPEVSSVVTPVPADCREVVLATDGYPILRGDLQSSEDALKELLTEDPLLHRRYRSTKAPVGPDGSFDDRCYVRLRLEAKA